jgi:hypothetical protein
MYQGILLMRTYTKATNPMALSFKSSALVERNEGYAMQWEVRAKPRMGNPLRTLSWKYD